MMNPSRIVYPWISSLFALNVIIWQLLVSYSDALIPYTLPEPLFRQDYFLVAAIILVLLIIFDITRFLRTRVNYDRQLLKYESKISDLFNTKRELATRAVTSSDHADKLKLFISDRLLEYIEYDEKFLHFKSIAAEVRHNGVISFDKVQTALKQALKHCDDERVADYQEASSSMIYLWDLLDLSTTDNIALHIANHIYDCEEHYFQSLLKQPLASEASPFTPTFSVAAALHRALSPLADDPEELSRALIPGDGPANYQDSQFKLQTTGASVLLGKQNHIVLLIENLLNNALFYASKKPYKNRHSRVAIQLSQQEGQAELMIYNRGPHIDDADNNRIFQLGFSTRRVREQHGKGLGLYFVNEITKGFEGKISYHNMDNRDDSFTLRFELTNGEIQTHMLNTLTLNNSLGCRLAQSTDPLAATCEWAFSSPISRVEVSSKTLEKPQLITGLEAETRVNHLDNSDALLPRWVLEVSNKKKTGKIVFTPLDVRGVSFVATFPTATSRLESQEESGIETLVE